jgi:dipeptidyl aminopeptidase/acylaminoacyl peptidase
MTRQTARAVIAVAIVTASIAILVASLQFDRVWPQVAEPSRHPASPPFVLFRTLTASDQHGRVAIVSLDHADASRTVTNLSCVRVHYAGGRGVCVVEELDGNVPQPVAYVFDKSMTRGRRIPLRGVPTRLRVAPNGLHAAVTTNAEEETPEGERLATDTVVVDLQSGEVIADLREFRIENDRLPPLSGPVDVGSVTFEGDSDRFYAFVATPKERYLAAGSLSARRMRTIRTGVACESLSPGGRRLVVKKPGDLGFWQLAVIDLGTWEERELAQGSRSVDDQVDWLDDQHVLFHNADDNTTSLWLLPIDGVGGPQVLVKDAYSGSVQR